jgi:uncharacterized protein YjbI with pentapeptide repeats
MDGDLLRFISNEFRAMTQAELLALQAMVRELLSYTINHGLPFPDEFLGKGFKEHLRLARNAEETLLAVHFHIAELTEQVSRLELEWNWIFGEWFRRLSEIGRCAEWLGYLNLSGYDLSRQNFYNPNFAMSILKGANLQGVNIENAILFQANLQDANLTGANLKDADFHLADLRDANLEGAN